MLAIAYVTFVILAGVCALLQLWSYIIRKDAAAVGNNPQFLKFQRGYFAVYLVAMFADWLQGPYLYKLYSYYGFQEDQIAVLYVFGFASTVIFGSWTPIAADQFGRKKLCIIFTVTYSLACLLKLSRSYGILIISRVLGGIATSVLFSAFEAWYVYEHLETHDFPKEWIPITFAKASMWNGVLAVVAGVTTNVVSEWFGLGPVAPYMIAVPFLIFVGIIISTHWNENYSISKVRFRKVCYEGLKKIADSEKIFMLGAIEALFESVIYTIIFLWTPILEPAGPSLGIVFSSFMVCILMGQAVFQILSSKGVPATTMLTFAAAAALVSNLVCVFSTRPEYPSMNASFIAFLTFQFCVGIYFPAMGYLRLRVIPDAYRYPITNWFRVPLNLITCGVLMLLHEDVFQHGNRYIFVICVCLLCLTLMCASRLIKLPKTEEEEEQEMMMMESEHIHNIF
ncbi:molybdate-anion transporter-like [Babylonia areolata]|uniref:molybdate-anion transporter-like n=1 Tax=Babylonia areolata TaxID=304850 RepID=UPI003FD22A2C